MSSWSPAVAALGGPAIGRKADLVFETLRSELVDGLHRPGTELSVSATAARLNVSKQPVMDAVRRLSESGFLEVVPQVGVRVVAPSRHDVEDFYVVFAALEAVVTGFAAERRTDADVAWLRREAAAMSEGISGDTQQSPAAYRRLYQRVHGAIHDMARSPVAASAARASWDRSDFLMACFGAYHAHDVAQMDRGHEELLDAIVAADAEVARRVAERHILESRDRVLRAMAALAD